MIKIYKNNELVGYGKNFISAITGCDEFEWHFDTYFNQVLNTVISTENAEIKTFYGVIFDDCIIKRTNYTFNLDGSISISEVIYIDEIERGRFDHPYEGYRWKKDDYPILDR